MDAYFNEANFIPFKRYLLQIVFDGRRRYNLTRFKNRADAMAEKSLLAAYRAFFPGSSIPKPAWRSSRRNDDDHIHS